MPTTFPPSPAPSLRTKSPLSKLTTSSDAAASSSSSSETITKLTNCRLIRGSKLVVGDLWVSSLTGRILDGQQVFYDSHNSNRVVPDRVIDLGGKIVSPGLIDVQLNGAYNVNFSQVPEPADGKTSGEVFAEKVEEVNRKLVSSGVTAYLPTLTSSKRDVYHAVLPHLGPSEGRQASSGSESLGAHCEGPFLSPTKNGCHPVEVLVEAPRRFADIADMYGAENVQSGKIKMITAAPELSGITESIPAMRKHNIIYSLGHSEATYEDASAAVQAGGTMITHLFNAMRPLNHRNPGIFGVLGTSETEAAKRPYFGLIADGIHLHPSSIKIAYGMHPQGCVLVTDAMHLVGMPDGIYPSAVNGNIEKTGSRLTLEGRPDKIAGSAVTLMECVRNFIEWTGASVPEAVAAVTSTPAKMLGLEGTKGCLEIDADADLVVFDDSEGKLDVRQVWKFGVCVYDKEEETK
jgi:N-acetylglucosamine-6-phosphate deacetylase